MDEIDQLFIFGKVVRLNKNENSNYKIISSPLVNGKEVSLNHAISCVREIILNKEIHFNKISCDIKTIDKILEISEEKRFSVTHANENEITNFYSAFQKYGGSLISLNELKNRSDFILIIGNMDAKLMRLFFEYLGWKNNKIEKDIFYVSEKVNKDIKNSLVKKDLLNFVNVLGSPEKLDDKRLADRLLNSFYPVVLVPGSNSFLLNQMLLKSLQDINNKIKNIKLAKLSGLNNTAGFVSSCVMKSGFPSSLSFTDWGIEYDPIESKDVNEKKEVQISITNFDTKPFKQDFKINIFFGYPNLSNKSSCDVFIPTKTPGIDTNGLILRSDGNQVIKLKKKIRTDLIETRELLEKIFN